LWQEKEVEAVKALLIKKATATNGWKADYIYSHKGYKTFATRNEI